MSNWKKIILSFSWILLGTYAHAQTKIRIENDSVKQIISPEIYGHFAEHLGHCIYNGIYVGSNSKKVSNTDGIRNDIIAALKKLKVPVLRWPGGCFADTYHWKDGVGPKRKRPSMINKWWGGTTEDNSFGTHEFLQLCRLIDAQPYLAGNTGSGSVQEFTDWVQYVNDQGKSPMSDLRKANGQKNAWSVKYWGIGNEAWGCGGHMRPEYYANIYRQYATFVSTDYDTSHPIFRIGSGPNSADYEWTETVMKNIPSYLIDGIALHHYAVIDWNKKGPDSKFDENTYFKTMTKAYQMEAQIENHSAIMDRYDPKKKIALVVDEWGGWYDVAPGTNPGFLYQQNTMRDAMIAAMTLNIFNNHSDRVRMACLAQIVNVLQAVILTYKEKMILTPTYHIMEMYNVHQNAQLVPLKFTSPMYELNGSKIPAVSASASVDTMNKMHISLANIDAKKSNVIELELDVNDYLSINGKILSSEKLNNYNSFDEPNKIAPVSFDVAHFRDGKISISIPPFSCIVLELTK